MTEALANLAPHSRVWVFQADRFFNPTEVTAINNVMKNFIPKWAAHGSSLYGDHYIAENLFLIIGVDETKAPASGCSIDSLTHTVQEIGAHLKVDFFNRLAITYENKEGKIEFTNMQEFKQLIAQNKIDHDTIVFNNLVNTKAEFITNWRTSAKNSWHNNLFQLA